MSIRVLVVDDHPLVRAGIIGTLAFESGVEIVGEGSDGLEALALVAKLSPDVVLMDLRMPGPDGLGLDGVAATARIVADYPATKVLILTTYNTDGDILRAVEAGAAGYLLKDAPKEDLVAAIEATARGETVLAPNLAAKLVSAVQNPSRLTARELEVLGLVAKGLSNGAIATSLFIGEATVKTHLLRIFNKLNVDDRTRAVTAAMEKGWLT